MLFFYFILFIFDTNAIIQMIGFFIVCRNVMLYRSPFTNVLPNTKHAEGGKFGSLFVLAILHQTISETKEF